MCAPLPVQELNKGYDVIHYDATITLDREADGITGRVTMTAKVTSKTGLTKVLQHAKYIRADSVILDGVVTRFTLQDTASGTYLVDAPAIPTGKIFHLTTFFHGPGRAEPGRMQWGGVTDSNGIMFSMGVGFGVPYTSCTRHWLPCYDLPDDKADSADLTFVTPSGDVTASNGLLVSNEVTNGKRSMHWHVSHPIASYLLCFASGHLSRYRFSSPSGIPVEAFGDATDSLTLDALMRSNVMPVLEFYDSLFGKYPFEKVGFVLAPIGSMEHQTMITLAQRVTSAKRANTVPIHELAHMYWGDWVTCRTFDDTWLNEGFATFSEALVMERYVGKEAYRQHIHGDMRGTVAANDDEWQLPLVGAATVNHHTNNYPGIIYGKGAAVLAMLRSYLGDSLFFEALRTYGRRHAYSTATTADFEAACNDISGQNLHWFFSEWAYRFGYPILSASWKAGAKGTTIRIVQMQDSTSIPFFRMPMVVECRLGEKRSRSIVWLDSVRTTTIVVQPGFIPDSVVLDPDTLLIRRNYGASKDIGALLPSEDSPNKTPETAELLYLHPEATLTEQD